MIEKFCFLAVAAGCAALVLGTKTQAAPPKGFSMLVVTQAGEEEGKPIQNTYQIAATGKWSLSGLAGKKEGQLEGKALEAFAAKVNAVDWAALPAKKVDVRSKALVCTVAALTDQGVYNRTFQATSYPDDKAVQAFLAALAELK